MLEDLVIMSSYLLDFCRFLQGPETDPATVRKIRGAIDNQTDVTVQLINYTKSGMVSLSFSRYYNISIAMLIFQT